MKYLLLLIFACANFSCTKSQASSTPRFTTVHCQVSPDTWKRYSVDIGDFSPLVKLQIANGTWRFRTHKGIVVYSTICHVEL